MIFGTQKCLGKHVLCMLLLNSLGLGPLGLTLHLS
jgi:hypothetical protein